MQPLRTDKRPFDQKVKKENATTWLVPKLVSEVAFTEWTSEGEMRHPVFLGLRPTKRPTTSSANKHEKFSMEVRSDHFEAAKSHFFDTSSWGPFCDVTLTLKQALQSDSGAWMKITDYLCRQAHRHFMNFLTEQCTEPHFGGTASAFVFYLCLKKLKSALAHCVRGSLASRGAGIFIVQLNCPRTSMLLHSKG